MQPQQTEKTALDYAQAAWAAYRGRRVYEATGDARTAVSVGVRSYFGFGYIACGITCIVLGVLMAFFWVGFLVMGLIVGVIELAVGLRLWRRVNPQYKAITQGEVHRVPPPVPGQELPVTSYSYGYDVTTGQFTRKALPAPRKAK